MTVTIDTFVQEDPEPTMVVLIRGAIAISIDGERLNRYQNEGAHPQIFDWYPEYVGEHILVDLRQLADVATALERDELELFDPKRIVLTETSDAIVIERVSVDEVRLAFQKAPGFGRESGLPLAESALGDLVRIDEFAAELLSCAEEVCSVVERFDLDSGGDFELFQTALDDLRVAHTQV